MVQIRYGDLAQNLLLASATSAAKRVITQHSQEATTGLSADTARHLSGNLGQINAVDASLARISAFKTATTELTAMASATQAALGSISQLGEDARGALLASAATVSAAQVDSSALSARTALEGVISTLNSRFGDRSLFAGTRLNDPAVVDFDTMMTALSAVTSAATSAADAANLVSDWFDAPTGYASLAYTGGPASGAVPVAEGEAVALTITAENKGLRNYMKGLAMGALLDQGLFAGQPETRRALAGEAGEALLSASSDLTYLAANLGASEAKIADSATRNSAEMTALQLARNDLVGVDSYEASTRLTDAEDKLQLLYALTSRLSNLSLVEYLR